MLPIAATITRGRGGDSLIKVGTDVRARVLSISGVNFCPSMKFCELNFARSIGCLAIVDKKYAISDKRMTKVTYLLKMSNSGTLKFMKTCPVIRFLGICCLGVVFFFLENFVRRRFCTRRTSVPTFITFKAEIIFNMKCPYNYQPLFA